MYLPMNQHVMEKIQSIPTTPKKSSTGAEIETTILPLDAAITQKFSEVVYSLKLAHVRDGRPFLVPCPPPPSPATPRETTPHVRSKFFRNKVSKMADSQASLESTIKNATDSSADAEGEMIQQNNYDVHDPLEKLGSNLEVTVEDLNNVLDENSEYCGRIYDHNPWFQYILLGDGEVEDDQPTENIPDATRITSVANDHDLEQFLASVNHPPVLDPEEIKAVLGVDLAISPGSGYFQCDQCSQKFTTREEILEHKEIEEGCESYLMGTVVGFDLGK